MATVVDWPAKVLAAAAIKFEAPVAAFLWKPQVDHPCLIGRVYMDLSGRFQDGRLIRTSRIIGTTEEQGWTIAITLSGSCYLLIQDESDLCFVDGRLLPPSLLVNSMVH
ncbi:MULTISPECIES: hypothetical protein [Pseudomonas syringae group]|uniref:hypothetical protein n=1 Tax=Pseudomonas syringae group TaxID=136849 RepID=UPI001604C979|nr:MULTISPECIES: hypothetical protein [Pseudomonas syringae group]MDU8608721.1 hypothetical protein [Pseudomonas syringae group sp. 247E2]